MLPTDSIIDCMILIEDVNLDNYSIYQKDRLLFCFDTALDWMSDKSLQRKKRHNSGISGYIDTYKHTRGLLHD